MLIRSVILKDEEQVYCEEEEEESRIKAPESTPTCESQGLSFLRCAAGIDAVFSYAIESTCLRSWGRRGRDKHESHAAEHSTRISAPASMLFTS